MEEELYVRAFGGNGRSCCRGKGREKERGSRKRCGPGDPQQHPRDSMSPGHGFSGPHVAAGHLVTAKFTWAGQNKVEDGTGSYLGK